MDEKFTVMVSLTNHDVLTTLRQAQGDKGAAVLQLKRRRAEECPMSYQSRLSQEKRSHPKTLPCFSPHETALTCGHDSCQFMTRADGSPFCIILLNCELKFAVAG